MSRYYNSRRNRVNKTIKDYLIPIIWIIIVLLIIVVSFSFSGNDKSEKVPDSSDILLTSTWYVVMLDDATTESYIYVWEKKEPLVSDYKLKPEDKIVVKEWTVSLELDWNKLKLNKMGELELTKEWVLKLDSESLWINATKSLDIETMYSKVKISANSIVSIIQNEAASTIYVISWFAEVSNLVWQKSLIWSMQKITISNKDASSESFDIKLAKDSIDDFFKTSDWYIKNNNLKSISSTWTWESLSWSQINSSTSLIELNDLRDETTVTSSKISISWKYYNDFVWFITLSWEKAKIDTINKTFNFDNIILTKKENDLVFKLYDTENNIIWKVVYTIYYNWVLSEIVIPDIKENVKKDDSQFTVKNYSLDSSKFKFTDPGTNPYTTYESLVTIRWSVPVWVVSKISVNWFTLWRFISWTSSWRYHADAASDNLKEWLNVYEVKYYWMDSKLIYTNAYTIIKKTKIIQEIQPEVKPEITNTWEIIQ